MKGRLKKRLIILIFFLLFLSGILLVKDRAISFFQTKKALQPFAQIKKESITKLVIENNKKKIEVYRKNPPAGGWYLKKEGQEFRADEERINKIIDAFLSLKKEEVVSTNKNKHQDFGIDKQKIVFFFNQQSKINNQQIFIGKSAGLNKTYLRLNNENEVFIVDNFPDVFYPEDFRDLSVYFIDNEEKISFIEINFDNNQTILEKKENKQTDWRIGEKIAKKDRVNFFLNDLKTLKANDILPSEKGLFLSKTVLKIKIKENNKEKTAYFFEKDKENYYLKTSTSDLIFQIPAAYVASLKKEEKDFTQ